MRLLITILMIVALFVQANGFFFYPKPSYAKLRWLTAFAVLSVVIVGCLILTSGKIWLVVLWAFNAVLAAAHMYITSEHIALIEAAKRYEEWRKKFDEKAE